MVQACIIACFTEFLGAVLLGANTAETIKGGILSIDYYVNQPEMLMLAMLCALVGSATWVLLATKKGWPVSSTHSVVGAIIGTGIAAFGGNSISWGWDGVAQIVTSWFLSPVAAGIVAAIIYTITKHAILRRVESFKWGIRLVPVYFFFTAAIEVFYIIYKGAPGTDASSMSLGAIIGISIGCAAVCAAFGQFFFCPWVVRRVKGRENLKWYHIFVIPVLSKRPTIEQADVEEHANSPPLSVCTNPSDQGQVEESEKTKAKELENEVIEQENIDAEATTKKGWAATKFAEYKKKFIDAALNGVRQDVRNLDNDKLQTIHANAEIFEDDAEYLFSFLQIITACMASFAHGSNDVSNAVGPISSIFEVWNTGAVDVSGKVPIPVWILVYGGAAIDLGLLTMGYRIMRSMGNNITFFTPSRGFCAELAAALTVLTCSKLGLPVSTTHCITGASAAIGLCNTDGYKAVNWKMLLWCFFSWFITLPAAGLVSGLMFAMMANAPHFV
jgi:phosphate/sulfate permease